MEELKKPKGIGELLDKCPKNQTIGDNLIRAWSKINSSKYEKIVCAISGGSDSDVMLDIVWQCDKDGKVEYVWFDTGLEYQATKDHLKYLEEKYGIKVKPYRAIVPIPTSCRKYGQPFVNKNTSEMIDRLQRHGFQWVLNHKFFQIFIIIDIKLNRFVSVAPPHYCSFATNPILCLFIPFTISF